MPTFEDIIYTVDGSAAVITINRPGVYNAFCPRHLMCAASCASLNPSKWEV